MRKVLCLLLFCAVLLTGCAGNPAAPAGQAGPVTITVWHDKEDAVTAVLSEAVKALETSSDTTEQIKTSVVSRFKAAEEAIANAFREQVSQ